MLNKNKYCLILGSMFLAVSLVSITKTSVAFAKKIVLKKGETYTIKNWKKYKIKSLKPKVVKYIGKGKVQALKCGNCIVKAMGTKKFKKYKFVVKKKTEKQIENKTNDVNINEQNSTPENYQQEMIATESTARDITSEHVFQNASPLDIKYYWAKTSDDLVQWFSGEDATIGDFKKTAEYYKKQGNFVMPVVSEINKIEVCSKIIYMTFYLGNNSRKIVISPMTTEEIETYKKDGSIQFLINKKGIVIDKTHDVFKQNDLTNERSIIGKGIWVRDSILTDGIETDCLYLKENYISGSELHKKLFVYNGYIISVWNHYSDITEYDSELMKSVSFTTIPIG